MLQWVTYPMANSSLNWQTHLNMHSALKSVETSPTILYKMNNPIDSSELWKHLQKFHNEKTIVIINGDDLRSKGVNISKSLSWERTA